MGFENKDGFHDDFISDIIDEYHLSPVIAASCDDGICIRERYNDNTSFYFITNETESEKEITFFDEYTNLLTSSKVSGKHKLASCEFLILSKKREENTL
jgi:beta-galactosidase GanA